MTSLTSSHLMLLPTLNCPAQCSYCFGPHQGSPTMSPATLEATARWARTLGDGGELHITFHGGEPLLPGARFYRQALPLLRDGLAPRRVQFAVQSNLWFLTDALCEVFDEYQVDLGTSLDGPEAINDAQRGAGYFARTMEGIRRARQHGLSVGAICTFTRRSAERADEIFDFFLQQGLGFSIHAAVPSLSQPDAPWALPPDSLGDLLLHLLDRYLNHLDRIRIGTLDAMCRSVSAGQGGICTFTDCIGRHLAVDPEGWITPCQRWAGMPQFRLGNVHDNPSLDDLAQSPVWRMWQERQERVAETCAGCPHWAYCRGGCPYDALAASGGRWDPARRDPYCAAYRRFFDVVTDRALAEVFSEENLQAVAERGVDQRYGLLQKGKLLTLLRGGPHPSQVLPQARRTVAAVALAMSASAEEAVARLDRLGLVTRPEVALASVRALERSLHTPPDRLVNAYIHITYACNLTCAHCYAEAGPRRREAMPVGDVLRLAEEAARLGFQKVVITGGEPLMHPQRDALLEGLAALRPLLRPTRLALRTNLAYPLTPKLIAALVNAADQVIVSLDGDEASHDARRGAGTYARTLANLRRLCSPSPLEDPLAGAGGPGVRASPLPLGEGPGVRVSPLPLGEGPGVRVMLAAVLTAAQAQGREGKAVRALGEELGVPVRIRPPLPLGRAAAHPPALESHTSLEEDGAEVLAQRTEIHVTCGLGMNVYIAPDGACYPCYALHGRAFCLGNAIEQGLKEVIASERFQALRARTVDTTPHCRACPWRYLCGGYCRAWRQGASIDAPPGDCSALQKQAQAKLYAALEALGIPPERWEAACNDCRIFDHQTVRLSD
jgi:uncharacterized protein